MDVMSSEAKRSKLLGLDSFDVESLKALALAQHAQLDSRDTQIENLKLLVLKLKRMHFGKRSEKMSADIEQLELRLEDLEANQAAAEPLSAPLAIVAVNEKDAKKLARRPLPAALPREIETIAPKQEACPDCGATLRPLGGDVPRCSNNVPARFKVFELCGRN
jgi:transposase